MADSVEVIELEISPIPPDTIDSCRAKLLPYIEATLREAGQDSILSQEHMNIQLERTFPTDAAIIAVITLLTGMALKTYEAVVITGLKKKFNVREKRKSKKK
jgi:hypothetical protein